MEQTVSTLNLPFFDVSPERGFLPPEDPVFDFGGGADPELSQLERLGEELPEMLQSHGLRRSIDRLGVLEEKVFDGLGRKELVMAARIYAFLASGYVHQVDEAKVTKIPRSVAVPLYSSLGDWGGDSPYFRTTCTV